MLTFIEKMQDLSHNFCLMPKTPQPVTRLENQSHNFNFKCKINPNLGFLKYLGFEAQSTARHYLSRWMYDYMAKPRHVSSLLDTMSAMPTRT